MAEQIMSSVFQGPGYGIYGPDDYAKFDTGGSFVGTGVQPTSSGGNVSNVSNESSGDDGEASRREQELRDEISSSWDSYIRGLDDQLGGLSRSKGALEDAATSTYNIGRNDLGLQLSQGQQSLNKNREDATYNQNKNLKDISSNIRNAFMAGNVFLGTKGASDSSAANQYSYALNKMGTQQRSNVMGETARILADVNARETNLKNIYNTELRNLNEQKNIQMNQIATWFYDAQRQIQDAKNQGRLNKSVAIQDLSRGLLDNAIQAMNKVQSSVASKQSALDSWANNTQQKLNAAKTNMNQTADFNPPLPQMSSISGNMQVSPQGQPVTYGGGLFNEDKEKNNWFGTSGTLNRLQN